MAEVLEVTEVRVRWVGHWLLTDVNIAVKPDFSVEQGHDIARAVRHELLHHLPYLGNATIHVDSATASGEQHHRMLDHQHDDLPTHSHQALKEGCTLDDSWTSKNVSSISVVFLRCLALALERITSL